MGGQRLAVINNDYVPPKKLKAAGAAVHYGKIEKKVKIFDGENLKNKSRGK